MEQYLKISEFARLCGIARKNLIFYDEIGLLKPERVLENGYRLYSYRQLDPASVISALREVGMALGDIKAYLDGRSPEALLDLLDRQKGVLAARMDRLRRIEAMLDARLGMTRQGISARPLAVEERLCPAEDLFVSAAVDCTTAAAAEQAAYDFYDLCDREGMTYGYPLGNIIPRTALEGAGALWPVRHFFKYPPAEQRRANYQKPAGRYLICCEHSYYDQPRGGYDRLFRYMEAHGCRVAGDAYEEFLLDEIAVKEPGDFLMQISIQVEKKGPQP